MKFTRPSAEIFVPSGSTPEKALSGVTHMGFGAHQDDVEILAMAGILECRRDPSKRFAAVVCTDGAGSPRAGIYANYTNEQMQETRWKEQRQAAFSGGYAAAVQLKHSSSSVKDPANPDLITDIATIFSAAKPAVIYTHNLADKHDTHVAVAVKLIQALRRLPSDRRPQKLYGCEVWRGLDWLPDSEKVVFDVGEAEHLSAALLGVYDSQIAGGKRYDLATMGRWRANATYLESHGVDTANLALFAMDLTPLIVDEKRDIVSFATAPVERLKKDIATRLEKALHKH